MLKSTLLLASTALVAAQSSSSEPCAAAAADLTQTNATDAQVAFHCLNSVPVDVEGNAQLIDELKHIWQFHSEFVWLKNPGDDWEFGALDIEAELDKVKNSLNSFSSEYAVQLAIQNITLRTGNFHFVYQPDILTVFNFSRRIDVASISENGKALPKLYLANEVASLAEGGSNVSEISDINGQNPYDFLKSTASSQYIDSDGLINSMVAKGDTDQPSSFMYPRKYDSPSINITWANGSTASFPTYAGSRDVSSFANVTDGQTFFDTFCTGSRSSPLSNVSDGAVSESKTPAGMSYIMAPRAPGPVPRIPTGNNQRRNKRQTITTFSGPYAENVVEQDSTNTVAGYFLNGDGYNDVAVLKIFSFNNPEESLDEVKFSTQYQATIASFLSKCISENKQKLIIDLRENIGGSTYLFLDTCMQLFPEMEPFSGQRYRATDAFVKIGDAITEIRNDPAKAKNYAQLTKDNIEESNKYRFWGWWHFLNADGMDFSGWDDFIGPVELNNDSFTKTVRYNYTDEVSILLPGWSFVNGTRPTPFNASNIVMFTDAQCGSSCASLHEELKNLAGVKAVTVGGRPENRPIQTVTGSKGGELTWLIDLQKSAQEMLNLSSTLSLSSFSADDDTISAVANVPRLLTRDGDNESRLQIQDQVRKGDASGTPLQYIYEASDCRIFYTATTYAKPDAAWKQVWDAFQDDSKCVEGSTGHPSSISGGFKPYGPGELKAEDQPPGSGGGNSGN